MRQLKIRQKLIISYLAIACLVGLSGWVGFRISRAIMRNLTQLADTTLPSLRELFAMRSAAWTMIEASSSAAFLAELNKPETSAELDRERERVLGAERLFRKSLDNYRELAGKSEGAYPFLGEIADLGERLLRAGSELRDAAGHGSIGDVISKKEALESVAYRYSDITALAIESDRTNFIDPIARARETLGRGLGYQFASTAALVLGSLGFAFIVSSNISRPIVNLKAAAARIGRGDLDAQVPAGAGDELGELAESFNTMARDLQRTVISKTYFDNVLSSMADIVLVTDLESRITLVNMSAVRLLGYPEEDLRGTNLKELFEPGSRNISLERIASDLQSVEVAMQARDGRTIPVSISSSSLKNPDGGLLGSVFVARDMSELKKIETELSLYRDRLGRAEQLASLGTLGAIIAHKFNQPLTAVRLFLQQCVRATQNRKDLPPLVSENLQSSLDEVSHMSTLIKDVLRLTRSSIERRASSVELARVAERTRQLLFEDARKAGLRIETGDFSGLPPLHAVEAEIEELFFILTQNAIQAAANSPSPCLRVDATQDGDSLTVIFADTCGGIAAEHLDSVFDTFFTTRSDSGGTGLGLAILKQIVTNHGGEVEVASELGKGTTFTVKLPLEAAKV